MLILALFLRERFANQTLNEDPTAIETPAINDR